MEQESLSDAEDGGLVHIMWAEESCQPQPGPASRKRPCLWPVIPDARSFVQIPVLEVSNFHWRMTSKRSLPWCGSCQIVRHWGPAACSSTFSYVLEQEGPYFVFQEWSGNLSPFEFLLPDSQSPSIKAVPPLSNTHSIPSALQDTHLHASQLWRFLCRAGLLLGCFTVAQVLQYLQAALMTPMPSLCTHCTHWWAGT